MLKNIQLALAIACAIGIGYIIGYQEPTIVPVNNQQNVDIVDLEKLAHTQTPEPTILMAFEIQHIDKSTSTFNIVTFSTTTAVAGFYKPSDGSISIRAYNWQKIKRFGEQEKNVPIVTTSVLLHEIVHMTTQRNTVSSNSCVEINNPITQERMAYDAGFYYEQIRSLEEDGHIVLSKD